MKKKWPIIIAVTVIIYFVVMVIDRNNNLNSKDADVSYTKGKIIAYKRGANVSPWLEYEFVVEGEKHIGDIDIPGDLRSEGIGALSKFKNKYYLVKYSNKRTKYNVIYLDKPIPDEITKLDNIKWETMPSFNNNTNSP